MTTKDKDLQHIKCPKCGWHGAVVNIKTGLITCQYCMYRSKKMTNKINGIDLSEWELKGVLIPISECKYFEGIGDCKESKGLCVDNGNCYFKQLKRLQEENGELWNKANKYRQTLGAIRAIIKNRYTYSGRLFYAKDFINMLDDINILIDEVLK